MGILSELGPTITDVELHPFLRRGRPIAMAHRGGAKEAPENTPAAFQRAVDLGFDYVESDLRTTRDGVVVLHHDASLERTSGLDVSVDSLDWSELAEVPLPQNERIMRLDDALATWPSVHWNLDIKDDRTLEPALAALDSPEVLERVCISSFSSARVRAARKELGPDAATSATPNEVATIMGASLARPFLRALRRHLPSLPVAMQVPRSQSGVPVVTRRTIALAHDLGIQVHVWVVDDEADMDRLLDMGVDGLITDAPTTLRSVLDRRGS